MDKSIKTSSRLLSIDVLRGITIAGMILVNNSGDNKTTYAPLKHAYWNSITPTDWIFPFFIVIMGISLYLSYEKFDFQLSTKTFQKLLRRSVLLFLIGLTLSWFNLFCSELHELRLVEMSILEKIGLSASHFEKLRILGVLQRLALISFFGSLIVLMVKSKYIPWLIGFILAFYWLVLLMTGSFVASENNIIAVIDRAILGSAHMYNDTVAEGVKLRFDPSGLLSTLPCIAQVLLGFLCGKLISPQKNNQFRVQNVLIFGTIILFAGLMLDYGVPINKKIWSSSFVLFTSGLCLLLFGLLIWIIDVKENKRWSVFFESFGVNPMFIYVVAALLSTLIGNVGFTYNESWVSIKSYFYTTALTPLLGSYLGSLFYAFLFVLFCWMIGHFLYKKKIFIKL